MFRRLHWIGLLALLLLLPLAAVVLAAEADKTTTEVWPAPGSRDVWLGSNIEVGFDVAVDHASAEAHFQTTPALQGKFVWQAFDGKGERVSFRPTEPLAPRTTYQFVLRSGILAAAGGVMLDRDYAWSFTTGAASESVTFGEGMPVQWVDPKGRNSVRVWTGYPRLTLDLALFALPTPDFAARYGALDPSTPRPIDVNGLSQVTAWRQYLDMTETGGGTVKLPALPSGIYVLTASHAVAGKDELYVVVSEQTLALKQGSDGDITAWAQRLQGQTAVAGMTVTLYDRKGVALTSGQTDAEGLVALRPGNGGAYLAVGEQGGNITLAGLNSGWQTGNGYWWGGWGFSPGMNQESYRVYLYTDRPIYRPGQTVNYAAILRRDTADGYVPVDASVPMTLTVYDSRGNQVTTQNPIPDDFGSIHGAIALAAEPPLGAYRLTLTMDNYTTSQIFEVDAYRKPEYEVKVTTAAPFAIVGDSVEVTIECRLFFWQARG